MAGNLGISDFKKGEGLLYKSMKVKTHGKEANTPVKAIDLSRIKPRFGINREESGINEIHKTVFEKDQTYKSGNNKGNVRISSIKSMNKDIELQESFEYNLQYLKGKARKKDITMCFLDYKGNHYPSNDEMEFIADISYEYSEVVPFPIISLTQNIKEEKDFKKYLDFLKKYYEILNTLNQKPTIGIIPKIGRAYLDKMFNFYYNNDITTFYFDFECSQPLRLKSNIRKFFRKLSDENILEKSFLHSTNIYSGRFKLSDYAINAKDILSFGLGFDSMGRNMRKPPPKEIIEKLPTQPERRFRLFSKKDYGYYQLQPEKVSEIIPDDTNIDINDFQNNDLSKYDLQNSFNMEQQHLEAILLRNIIKETPENYLKDKTYVSEDDISTLKKLHDFVMKSKSTSTKKDKSSKPKMKSLFDY